VPEGALHVQALSLGTGKQPGGEQVHRDPDHRHDHDERALDLRRLDEPADALVDDQGAEQEQGDAIDLGGQDLRPLHPVGEAAGRRALGEAERRQGQSERDRVGEHVPGVGEQGQGGGDDAGHDLGDHEGDDQGEGDAEATRIGIARLNVAVGVIVAHAVITAAKSGPKRQTPGFRPGV
jgi:hypothetical protein